MTWRDLQLRMRALLFRRRAEEEMDAELRFHLEMQARKHREAGLAELEAGRRARQEFGGVAQVQEECRDGRGIRALETLLQDVRYALRGFRRAPGFAAAAVAIIALGLGLNTAIFTAFDAYVLRPLAVRDPSSLYEFSWTLPNGREHRATPAEFADFRRTSTAFAETLGFDMFFTRVEGHYLFGELVTGNYFTMLGGDAALGRTLTPDDAPAPGTQPVAVLSFTAWKNKFARDPEIVGKKLVVRGYPLTVVGVAREGFPGIGDLPVDFWAPLTMGAQLQGGSNLQRNRRGNIEIVGRLRRGWSPSRTKASLAAWAHQYTADSPFAEKAVNVRLLSRASTLAPRTATLAAMSSFLASFGLVLLVACANIANLMLARAMARQREIGVRLAMGAARSRLIRQLLTESVLLAAAAAVVGFGISQATIGLAVRLLYATTPAGYLDALNLVSLSPDVRVFAFMLAAAIAATLLFGLMPALQATRPNIMQAARGEFTTDFRPSRLRHALVIAQVAVSALILISAAILLRANLRIGGVDPGLQSAGVIELDVEEPLRERVVQQLAADSLVQSVAAAGKVPFMGQLPELVVRPAESKDRHRARFQMASPEYFAIFQVPLVRGRSFTADEARGDAGVAVISEATARRLFPDRDAVGRTFRISAPHGPGMPMFSEARVIGVARDAINGWIGDGTDSTCIYFPTTLHSAGTVLLARVAGNGDAARQRLDASLARDIPGAIDQIHSVDEILAVQLYPFRVVYWVSAALGAVALLLTLTGLYGVLAYLVAQRTKEIGIRVALGAGWGQVAGLVLKQSLRLAATGTAVGSLAALGLARILAALIPNIPNFDAAAFGVGMLLVFAASVCAAWMPSLRAARIEPVATLRCD